MEQKSLETAMAVQSEYLRARTKISSRKSTRIGELYAGLAKEAYKPFEGVLGKPPVMK